ncbi:unnamed protein product [Calicophoron daubneyi]|uniref:GT23 domain-containing protein n=1 Tax=Calicophoron daubneyi TaxID=300641 RepID=A0AAV2TM53_CALDB
MHRLAGKNFASFRTVFLIIVILWIFVAVYFLSSGIRTESSTQESCGALSSAVDRLQRRTDESSARLRETLELVEHLKKQSKERGNQVPSDSAAVDIGLSHEILRRRSVNYAREIWYTTSKQLDKLRQKLAEDNKNPDKELVNMVDSIRGQLSNITLSLMVDLDGLGRVDGLAASNIRGLTQLSRLVQNRLTALQNPSNCATSKFLIVSLNRPCAFGCNVHHLVYCFQMAYATGRTLLIGHDSSPYSSWWERNFEPLSNKCNSTHAQDTHGNVHSENIQGTDRTVVCPYICNFDGKLGILPPAIPEDLATALNRFHDYPSVWFIGQLLYYLMRPKPHLQRMLDELLSSYGMTSPHHSPVVGIHVRRTDKINTEAQFHSLREYMVYVDRYFDFIDEQRRMMARNKEWVDDALAVGNSSTSKVVRQVFIATDEPSVFQEAKTEFPNYIFYGDTHRAESASVGQRRGDNSILGIAVDIILLSRTDYIVCTFSSQVCRVSYELMQTRHQELGDASSLVQSLDDVYYFGGQQSNPFEVVVGDTRAQRGELVHMRGNHWDGYSLVENVDGGGSHLIPSYKLRRRIITARMGNRIQQP